MSDVSTGSQCRLCGFLLELHTGPLGECPDPKRVKMPNRSGYVTCGKCGSTGSCVTDEPSVVEALRFRVVKCSACNGRGWVLPKAGDR